MSHYARLATLGFRVFGIVMLMYAVPIVLLSFVRVTNGSAAAEQEPTPGAFLAWLVYAVAGLVMYLIAPRLGRLAARGLDPEAVAPPAA